MTCGRWQHYHAVTDTPDKIDYDKIAATVDLLRALTVDQAERPEQPVVFRPHASDDVASLRTVRELGQLLLPRHPELEAMRSVIDALLERAAAGPLKGPERAQVQQLVGGLEALVSG